MATDPSYPIFYLYLCEYDMDVRYNVNVATVSLVKHTFNTEKTSMSISTAPLVCT